MKKILIVSHALQLGGAERSLIGLLETIDPKEYQVDLFLLRHEGELMQYIPSYVNLLPEIPAYTVLARPIKDVIKEGHLMLATARVVAKLSADLYIKKYGYSDKSVELEYSHKYLYPLLPKIEKNTRYDLAISFLTPHYFVAKKVNAKKKIAWIHTDYTKIQVNVNSELKMWDSYDNIVSISNSVTKNFLKVFSSLASKIVLIENILSKSFILRQSEQEDFTFSSTGVNILSIGRYCEQKNFDNVPDICRRLVEKGLNVYWYIIGFGPDEKLIKEKIKQNNMCDRVILLGKKQNPYPYIKCCDLYVQPSRYEGKSVTVREAQILSKPVVITNYPTASDQLTNNYDGIIVPLDNERCADGIFNVLNNSEKMAQLSSNCKLNDYTNSKYVNKLYELVD